MSKQYCKVGSTTPLSNEKGMVSLLESRYNQFIERANQIANANPKMGEFFQFKAMKIQRTLEKLVA